jgi:hypothetical protein
MGATASAWISSQCFATNFVAWSLTSSKSPPTRPRAIVASGSGDQISRCARYFEKLPQRMTKAQSILAVLQADNRNTLAIRSGPSCSSRIVSESRRYLSDFTASEAPDEKYPASVSIDTRRAGVAKVNIQNPPGATLPRDSLIECEARCVAESSWISAQRLATNLAFGITRRCRARRAGLTANRSPARTSPLRHRT